ncbi:hypothetical protein Tco_1422413 [Tanacetum coccineum]
MVRRFPSNNDKTPNESLLDLKKVEGYMVRGEEDEKELVEMGEVVKALLVKEKVVREEGYDFASKVLEWLFGVFMSNHERISSRMT